MTILPFTRKALAPPQTSTSSDPKPAVQEPSDEALIGRVFTRHDSLSDHATHAVCDVQIYGYMMEDLTTGARFKIKHHELAQRFRPGRIQP
jgi:hypothetical protein